MIDDRPTRGERNKNPGNLEFNPNIRWEGLAEPPEDVGGYCVFTDAAYGLRALYRDIHTKWAKHGFHSVTQIISIYAPPTENDTEAYIKAVSDWLGVNPDEALDLDSPTVLLAFGKAIVEHENGRVIYSDAQLRQAVDETLGVGGTS